MSNFANRETESTTTQIRPHYGFASGPIHLRQMPLIRTREESPASGRLSASLPKWAKQSKCLEWDETETIRKGDWSPYDDDYATANRARALCEGCPVILACLEAAMEEEAGKGSNRRHGVRGGLNPAGRTKLAFGGKCRHCGHQMTTFTNAYPRGRCHRCEARKLRARRAEGKVTA